MQTLLVIQIFFIREALNFRQVDLGKLAMFLVIPNEFELLDMSAAVSEELALDLKLHEFFFEVRVSFLELAFYTIIHRTRLTQMLGLPYFLEVFETRSSAHSLVANCTFLGVVQDIQANRT